MTTNLRSCRRLCSTGTRTTELTVGVAECTSRLMLVWLEMNPIVLQACGAAFSSLGFNPHTHVLPWVVVVEVRLSKMLDIMTTKLWGFRCICGTGTRTIDLTVGVAERTSRFVLVWFEVSPLGLPTCGTAF